MGTVARQQQTSEDIQLAMVTAKLAIVSHTTRALMNYEDTRSHKYGSTTIFVHNLHICNSTLRLVYTSLETILE